MKCVYCGQTAGAFISSTHLDQKPVYSCFRCSFGLIDAMVSAAKGIIEKNQARKEKERLRKARYRAKRKEEK